MFIRKLVLVLLLGGSLMPDVQAALISHTEQEFNLESAKARILAQDNPMLAKEEQLSLLTQLTQFDLGKFLLKNQGLNGPWTSYVILHGLENEKLSELEKWFLEEAPVVLATRERFGIFQSETQKRVQDGMVMASVPCGLMEDLMTLGLSSFKDIQLVGLDLDAHSVEGAKRIAGDLREKKQLPNSVSVSFEVADAWGLQRHEVFDVITSNGLNIYEKEDERVVQLYQEFYKALKEKGTLVTSFLTPPPAFDPHSPWHMDQMDPRDLLRQKVLMGDIIGAKWTCFRTEETTRQQLTQAGFRNIQVIYDRRGMFPTVIAEK